MNCATPTALCMLNKMFPNVLMLPTTDPSWVARTHQETVCFTYRELWVWHSLRLAFHCPQFELSVCFQYLWLFYGILPGKQSFKLRCITRFHFPVQTLTCHPHLLVFVEEGQAKSLCLQWRGLPIVEKAIPRWQQGREHCTQQPTCPTCCTAGQRSFTFPLLPRYLSILCLLDAALDPPNKFDLSFYSSKPK
jgi:hypothetical protein